MSIQIIVNERNINSFYVSPIFSPAIVLSNRTKTVKIDKPMFQKTIQKIKDKKANPAFLLPSSSVSVINSISKSIFIYSTEEKRVGVSYFPSTSCFVRNTTKNNRCPIPKRSPSFIFSSHSKQIVLNTATITPLDFRKKKHVIVDEGASGVGVEKINIVSQKNNFMQIKLNFKNALDVSTVENIPSGMVYENGFLKGVPVNSGTYNIILNLTDGSKLMCSVEIPKLQRLL